MKYKCLVFDHDDTVVNSTATIHYTSFVEYLKLYHPEKSCTLEEYFEFNFDPGFLEGCLNSYGFTEDEIDVEVEFWKNYVSNHVPEAYPGIKAIMDRHRAGGGIIAVVSHSIKDNILRDYAANGLPEPDLIYGWEEPPEHRKPNVWPLERIMEKFGLERGELLMIDDLKPGYDMAAAAGVDFAAVGWSNDVEKIESFMRENCSSYFKTVSELAEFLA